MPGAYFGHVHLLIVAQDTTPGDILAKIYDVENGEQSTPHWVRHVLPVSSMLRMLGIKVSDVGVL